MQKQYGMGLLDIEKEDRNHNIYLYSIDSRLFDSGGAVLRHGFYILLVSNGTVAVSFGEKTSVLSRRWLAVLSPSMTCRLERCSHDMAMSCLYIRPDYFDRLPDGQPMYNQLSKFSANDELPAMRLEQNEHDYLHKTIDLFSDSPHNFSLYDSGITMHLCSFMLLQISDIMCRSYAGKQVCVIRRSTEIFRNFKRLAVNHYKNHHDIAFYADRLNISTTYLSRIVKSTSGHTVRFHISELICAEARRLLDSSDMDIKKIADALGFSDQSVFGKFFQRRTGLSPMKYRLNRGLK